MNRQSVKQLRQRVASLVDRAQLGPTRELERRAFAPGRVWHNHRSHP